MFAQIFECPNCGDVWRGVQIVEHIDCERDDIECVPTCACGQSVREKVVEENGERLPVWHALTDEEIQEEQFSCWDG